MRTVLLSLVAMGVLSGFGIAAENREDDAQLQQLAREAATAAEALNRSGTQIPRNYSIRRSILHLSDRIARTAKEWPGVPSSDDMEQHRQKCRDRARRLLEDSENLLEAIRSFRNSAEAAHDVGATREARRMITSAWTLRVTVRKLQREAEGLGTGRVANGVVW